MRRYLWIAVVLGSGAAGACRSSESASNKAKAAEPGAKAATQTPTAETGDADLARMKELASGPPGSMQYPQADAVIALDRDDVTIAGDGTVVEHHKSIVKLLDAQRGKEKFADVHIPYDTKRQKLELVRTRTVNDDGVPHEAAAEEIGDIVPAQLADATIYSDVRERVVSFPAVDKGSVVELEYKLTTKATPDAPLGGELMLGAWDPILDRTVTITAPAGREPKLSVQGVDLKVAESSTADGKTWTYHLENQPDRHPESSQPVDAAVLPRVVYGFQPSWQKVLEPVAERFLKAAVPQPLPETVKAEADRLVAGAKTDVEKAQKLFAFVSHDVRTIDLPLGWAGYEPHSPDVVLANRYGDERDKVGLMLALAAAEGISGKPVLVRTGKVPVIASVPTIAQFDRIVAKLDIGGSETWIAPSDEYAQYGVVTSGQDNLVLPLQKGGAELGARPPLDPSSSVMHYAATYALSANGDVDAKITQEATGWYADLGQREMRALKGEHVDQFFQEQAAMMSPSALDKGHEVGDTLGVAGPFTWSRHVALPGYATQQAGYRVFELPVAFAGQAAPSTGLSTRKYALFADTPRTEKTDVSVQVPAGWKIAYVPPKLDGSADGVSFSSECTASGQTVTCHAEVKVDKLVITPEQYPAFRAALAKLEAYERRVVLLVKA